MTIGNPDFCLALYLTGVYFRGKLQHVRQVGGQKSTVDQSEFKKQVVSDCRRNYVLQTRYYDTAILHIGANDSYIHPLKRSQHF